MDENVVIDTGHHGKVSVRHLPDGETEVMVMTPGDDYASAYLTPEAAVALRDALGGPAELDQIQAITDALMARRNDWQGTTGPGFSLQEPNWPQEKLARSLAATALKAAGRIGGKDD